jgi:hypothetical protein
MKFKINILVITAAMGVAMSLFAQQNKDMGKAAYTRAELASMCGALIDAEHMKVAQAKQDSAMRVYRSRHHQPSLSKTATIPNWKSMMSPVENQGSNCGSCWAHAATGVVEGQLHILKGSNIGIDLDDRHCPTIALQVVHSRLNPTSILAEFHRR